MAVLRESSIDVTRPYPRPVDRPLSLDAEAVDLLGLDKRCGLGTVVLMDLERARDFIREHHEAIMLTYRRDGSPQLSPVACNVDIRGQVIVSTRETALKTKNLRRDPRLSLCVITDGFYGEWIQVDGTAEVVSLPDAMELLVEYYRSTAGEHPDWDDYRAAMERERRVLVRITLERAGPDRAG
jgi:PPOX class probable F420-dependent enzyme